MLWSVIWLGKQLNANYTSNKSIFKTGMATQNKHLGGCLLGNYDEKDMYAMLIITSGYITREDMLQLSFI